MFTTVMWAGDGSDEAYIALEYAVEIVAADNADLLAIHVVEKIVGGRAAGEDANPDEHAVHAAIRRQLAERQGDIGPLLHLFSAATGHVADRIAGEAHRRGADLIVVGTRGRSALAGAMTGSVTRRLLQVAKCPVFVVPPACAREMHRENRQLVAAGADMR